MRRLASNVETALGTDLVATESFAPIWTFTKPGNNSCQTTLRGSFPVCRAYRLCLWVRHHGLARPQVADGGTASDMEGSWE